MAGVFGLCSPSCSALALQAGPGGRHDFARPPQGASPTRRWLWARVPGPRVRELRPFRRCACTARWPSWRHSRLVVRARLNDKRLCTTGLGLPALVRRAPFQVRNRMSLWDRNWTWCVQSEDAHTLRSSGFVVHTSLYACLHACCAIVEQCTKLQVPCGVYRR